MFSVCIGILLTVTIRGSCFQGSPEIKAIQSGNIGAVGLMNNWNGDIKLHLNDEERRQVETKYQCKNYSEFIEIIKELILFSKPSTNISKKSGDSD